MDESAILYLEVTRYLHQEIRVIRLVNHLVIQVSLEWLNPLQVTPIHLIFGEFFKLHY